MNMQAESEGVLKQKVRACSKRSSFSQSVSMRDHYINLTQKIVLRSVYTSSFRRPFSFAAAAIKTL